MANTADQNLAPEQYPDMNARFFAAEQGPSAYLQQRLRALVLGASRDDRVRQAVAEGLEWGTLRIGFPADGDTYADDAVSRFVTLDATVLLHHAAESLMRLYFAIEDLPPCPWLEVGRLREGAFKKRLRDFIAAADQASTTEKVRRATSGFATYEDLVTHGQMADTPVEVSRETWEKSGDAVALLISHAARVLVDDAPVYNAAKHGLAVIGGEAAVRLGDGDVLDVSGPSLTYLDLRNKDGQEEQKRWNETTTWITADRSLALVGLLIDRLDVMWRIARSRYAAVGGFRVRGLSMEAVEAVMSHPLDGERGFSISVEKMSVELLYLTVPESLGGRAPVKRK